MRITPNVLASLVGGKIEGEGEIEITGLAKIEEAKPGEISFISNQKYAPFASTTSASALLVSEDFEAPADTKATLIRVKDPYFAMATLLQQMAGKDDRRGIEQPAFIGDGTVLPDDIYVGAFSYIGRNVRIGRRVKIYPQTYIGDNVEIGDDTVIRQQVSVYEGCKIGARCIIHSGAVIGADGFGFAPVEGRYMKIPQVGIVEIKDDVEIGANTTIDRATMGSTVIGRGTKLDNLIQVAHNVTIGEDNVFAAQTGIAGSTRIGDKNRIGGQVGFAGHIKFGSNCEVGAQSGLNKGFGDGKRVIGYPAMDIKEFAKGSILMRRLPELFDEVREMKKELGEMKEKNDKEIKK